MKYILSILIIFLAIACKAQQPNIDIGSPLVNTVQYHSHFKLNLKMPVSGDTTLNDGADSVGLFIFRLIDTSVYVRVPNPSGSGNIWDRLLRASDIQDGVLSFNGRTGTVTLTSLDVTNALGYTPADSALTITINGVTKSLSEDRIWTVGDVYTTGTYANPSWITSLAWDKITGAPSFGSVTSFTAGNLSPLFTSSVSNPSTTPALNFALSNASANTWFGNNTGSSAAPSYNSAGTITKTDDTNVTLTLGGSPASSVLKSVSLQLGWTGTLAISRGGLGTSTAPSNRQFLMGNGSGGYTFVSLVAGDNVSIDYSTGAVTINASSSGSGGGGGVFIDSF